MKIDYIKKIDRDLAKLTVIVHEINTQLLEDSLVLNLFNVLLKIIPWDHHISWISRDINDLGMKITFSKRFALNCIFWHIHIMYIHTCLLCNYCLWLSAIDREQNDSWWNVVRADFAQTRRYISIFFARLECRLRIRHLLLLNLN